MAHFEQAALLATAWANDIEVKAMALNHSIVQVSASKKLRRSRVLSCTFFFCDIVYHMHVFFTGWYLGASSFQLGDLKRNNAAIGLAVKHCGLRPSLAMFEQAAHQFFALALPRGKDICSD